MTKDYGKCIDKGHIFKSALLDCLYDRMELTCGECGYTKRHALTAKERKATKLLFGSTAKTWKPCTED
jgi:hypothetical protein